ncbi:MAG: hypothetical protein JNK11_06560 [Alphaproteobacteria bacterium]|nr:hypothetical protein [Alphaproteobacteria bacterium]
MAEIATRESLPYGSVQIRVPAHWNEDPMAKELCVYFYPNAGGPPTFYLRRDDFLYRPGAVGASDSIAFGGGAPAVDEDALEDEMFAKFKQLIAAINMPDVYYPSIEPRSLHGQIVRYRRHGVLQGKPGLAWWWVKAQRVGETFTVLSCCFETFAELGERQETRDLVAFFDREFCAAEILSLEEAEALAEEEGAA